MTPPAKQYRLIALAMVLSLVDLAVLSLLPLQRLSMDATLAILAGLDLVVAVAWLVVVTLTARRRARQSECRLKYDKDSYWAKAGSDRK